MRLSVALIIFGVLLTSCIPLSELSYTDPTPVVVSHTAVELNGLTQLWSRNDVYVLALDKTLDASAGIACFVGDLGKALRYDQVVCFKSGTGEVAWKGVKAVQGLLAVTPVGIFVADLGSSYRILSALSKYDLQSGELIWQKEFFDSNPVGLQFFDNQVQLITWKNGQKLWLYDTDGNVLKVINNTYAFITTPGVTYSSETGIRAVRTDTSEVLWDHVDTGITLTPIFTRQKIFSRSNSYSGTVYALDRNTGKLLGQIHNIVYSSNLAYSPEKQKVYALRNDGALLAIDENTFEVNIAARFSSPLFLSIIDGTAEAYEFAYDQDQHILLVLFGDSHQLFAFKEE